MCPRRQQAGHVLWLVVVILGSLAQLAIFSIQQGAASGLSVQRIEAYWQRELLVEHIAEHLQRLPLLRVSAADEQALWHPLSTLIRSACDDNSRNAFTQTPCIDAAKARWAWRLTPVGEPVATWPGLITQRYQLAIQAMSAGDRVSRWQYTYEQRSLP